MPVRLPRSAENDLVIIAQTRLAELGAEAARQQLLIAHEKVIHRLALTLAELLGRMDLTSDLARGGMSALDQAIDQFEPYKEVAFGNQGLPARLWACSSQRVVAAMQDFLSKMAVADLRRQTGVASVLQAHDEILKGSGRKPTPAEIAAKLHVAEGAVEDALNLIGIAGNKIFSLSHSMGQKESIVQSPDAAQSSDNQFAPKERFPELIRALRHLRSPRYGGHYDQVCDFFALRYFEGLEVGEIAKLKGLDQATVWRELETNIKPALNHLMTHLADEALVLHRAHKATAGQLEHIEMHLAETSPGARYCQRCYERFAALK